MWLIPFSPGLDHVVTIRFDRAESIAGLRFWNYNKSPEDTYRGVSWGIAAELSPLSGKRRLDEWLVWLPERSINLPELSKWSWGRGGYSQGENTLPLASSAKSKYGLKRPGQTRDTLFLLGARGFPAGPGPSRNGRLRPAGSLRVGGRALS